MFLLDNAGVRDLAHPKIVEVVRAELDTARMNSPGWWAQGVAVAYEQHIGRRQPGQRVDGTFEVSVNKNMDGPREEVFARLLEWAKGKTEFNGQVITNVRTSETPVRSYWRCNLDDGSKIEMAVGPRSRGNFMVTISHAKLHSSSRADEWRSFWKSKLSEL